MKDTKEERDLQVTAEMENLKGRLAELEKGIESLKNRLASVLRTTETISEKSEKGGPQLVPLADDIKISANRVNSASIDILDILRTLEL